MKSLNRTKRRPLLALCTDNYNTEHPVCDDSQSQHAQIIETNVIDYSKTHPKNDNAQYKNNSLNPAGVVRKKYYSLNRAKGIDNKIQACSRRDGIIEEKSGNLVITLSTAGFEKFRCTLLSNIHIPASGRASRHVTYTVDKDESGLTVSDSVTIKGWPAFSDRISRGRIGPCSIVVNMYRTQSRILINGANYRDIEPDVRKLLQNIKDDTRVSHLTHEYKEILQRNTHVQNEEDKCVSERLRISGVKVESGNEEKEVGEEELCPTCDMAVLDNGVLCDVCEVWSHYSCENLSPDKIIEVEETNDGYMCKACFRVTENNTSVNIAAAIDDADNSIVADSDYVANVKSVPMSNNPRLEMCMAKVSVTPPILSTMSTSVAPSSRLSPYAVVNKTCGETMNVTSACMQPIQATVSQLNTSTSKKVTRAAVSVTGPITNTMGCLQPKPYCPPQVSTVQSTYSTCLISEVTAPAVSKDMQIQTLVQSYPCTTSRSQGNIPNAVHTPSSSSESSPLVNDLYPMTLIPSSMQAVNRPTPRNSPVFDSTMHTSMAACLPSYNGPCTASRTASRVLNQRASNDTGHMRTISMYEENIANDELCKLTHEYKALLTWHSKLQHDSDLMKKKTALKEKQIKAKEAALEAREVNQNEREEQIKLLKMHVNKLELMVKDLEEQNKLWKLKLLASKDVRGNGSIEKHERIKPMSSITPESLTSTLQTAIIALIAEKITDPCKSDSKPDVHYICCCGSNPNRETCGEKYPMVTLMSHHSENFKLHAHRRKCTGNYDTDYNRGYGKGSYQTHWVTEHGRPYYDWYQVRPPRQYTHNHSRTEWIVHDYNHGMTSDYTPQRSSVPTVHAKRAALYADRSHNDVTVGKGKAFYKEDIKDNDDYNRKENVHMKSNLYGNIRNLSNNQILPYTAPQENIRNGKEEKYDDEKEIARKRNPEDVSKDVERSGKEMGNDNAKCIKKEVSGCQTKNENKETSENEKNKANELKTNNKCTAVKRSGRVTLKVNETVERSGNVTDKINITKNGEYVGNHIHGNEPEPNTDKQDDNANESKTSEDKMDVTREEKENNKSTFAEKLGSTVVTDIIREKHVNAKDKQDHKKNDLSRNQAESNKLNEERNNDDKSESSEVENKITNEYEANKENDDMERTGRTLSDEIGKEMKDNTEIKLDHMMKEISSRLSKLDITDQEHGNREVIATSEAEKGMRKHDNDIVNTATVYSRNASYKDNIKVWQENTREYGDGSVNEKEVMFEGYGECDYKLTDWNTRSRRSTAATPPTPFFGITWPPKDPDISKLQVSM